MMSIEMAPTKFEIQELIATSSKKLVTKKLTAIFAQLETAISNGVSYTEIVQALSNQGIVEISVETFRKTLYRIRQKENPTRKSALVKPVESKTVAIGKSSPPINSTESATAPPSSKVKMTLQEIQDQAPHLSAKDSRARFADQYMQDTMHPLTKSLLEKSK
jgi:hypothetical protein